MIYVQFLKVLFSVQPAPRLCRAAVWAVPDPLVQGRRQPVLDSGVLPPLLSTQFLTDSLAAKRE